MTIGVGGSNIDDELKSMKLMTADLTSILEPEYEDRIQKAKNLMTDNNIDALFLGCSTNL